MHHQPRYVSWVPDLDASPPVDAHLSALQTFRLNMYKTKLFFLVIVFVLWQSCGSLPPPNQITCSCCFYHSKSSRVCLLISFLNAISFQTFYYGSFMRWFQLFIFCYDALRTGLVLPILFWDFPYYLRVLFPCLISMRLEPFWPRILAFKSLFFF